MNTQNSPYVFLGRVPGEPAKEIKDFWKKVLKEAQLDGVRIHDLRHTHTPLIWYQVDSALAL